MPPLVQVMCKTRTSLRTMPVSGAPRRRRKGVGLPPSCSRRRASRRISGWAQLPPIQPVSWPLAWMMALAPGFAEVGRSHQTTVASTNGSPACLRRYARSSMVSDIVILWKRGKQPSQSRVQASSRPYQPGRRDVSWPPSGELASALLIGRQGFFLEDSPHLPGAERNIDMAYANVSQRIDNGISNRLWCANSGRLADALGPDGMVRRGRYRLVRLPVGRLHRGGEQVVLEVACQNVASLIKRDLLIHRWSQSLGQATVNLPLNDHWVDDGTTIIHGHKAANMHLAGATVDIHNADVTTKRIGEVGWIVVVHCLQAWLQVRWTVGVSGKSQLLNGLAFAGRPLDEETPWLPFEVLLPDLQQIRCDLFGFVAHLTCCYCGCSTSHRRTPAGIGPQAVGGRIGVPMLDIHIIGRHAQFCGDDLGKGRLMPLTLRLHTYTREYLARGMDANLTAIEHLSTCDVEVLAGTSTHYFSKGRDADAHQFTTCPLFGLFAAEPFVVHILHRQAQCGLIIATIVGPVQSRTIGESLWFDEVL